MSSVWMQENKFLLEGNLPAVFIPAPPLVGIHPNPGPGSGEHLEEEIKWRAVILWKDKKLSPYKIAKQLKIDHKTASSIIKRFKETGTVHDRPRSGRKRKLSPSDVKSVVKMAKKRKSAPQIARSLKKTVDPRTIQRRLREEGFVYKKFGKPKDLRRSRSRSALSMPKRCKTTIGVECYLVTRRHF